MNTLSLELDWELLSNNIFSINNCKKIDEGSEKKIYQTYEPSSILALEANKSPELYQSEYRLAEFLQLIYPQHFPHLEKTASNVKDRDSMTIKEKINEKLKINQLQFSGLMEELGFPYIRWSRLNPSDRDDFNFNETKYLMSEFLSNLRQIGIEPYYNFKDEDPRNRIDFANVNNFGFKIDKNGYKHIVYLDTVYPFIHQYNEKHIIVGKVSGIVDLEIFNEYINNRQINNYEIFTTLNHYLSSIKEVNDKLI